jgi:membrane associated rhomboid family serine protease
MGFNLTPVVRNILLVNLIIFILDWVLNGVVNNFLSLKYIESTQFSPYQFFTYMFAHADFGHIFYNMLGLFFFGPLLETFWGFKKFLFFYIFTGIGAAFIYTGVEYIQTSQLKNHVESYISSPTPEKFESILNDYPRYNLSSTKAFATDFYDKPEDPGYIQESIMVASSLIKSKMENSSMLGASGAIFAILAAFAFLFPNTEIMLLFFPVPIKAKYIVMAFFAYSFYIGFQSDTDNVAHFAHLGGIIFAFIIIMFWKKTDRKNFY